MDDLGIPGTTGNEPLANGADTAPAAGLISQYVKDLSFENPNAPAVYQEQQAPEINVQFDIAAAQVAEEVHEVTLKIEVRATTGGKTAFIAELSYAGLFGLRNVPADHIQPFLLGEGPRLLFPFARRVVADAIPTAASRRCCWSRSTSTHCSFSRHRRRASISARAISAKHKRRSRRAGTDT